MENFKREKGEPLDVLAARLIKNRAQGRCEYEWYEGLNKHRCRELHGETALNFRGIVHLELMPTNGLHDRRPAHLKAYCQRHAYELLGRIAANVGGGLVNKRPRELDKNQVVLL